MALVQSSFRDRMKRHELPLEAPSVMKPIVIKVPKASVDPYETYRRKEEAIGGPAVMMQLTYDHPDSVRARKVAALRDELAKPFEPRFPSEGRSCRVYAENRR